MLEPWNGVKCWRKCKQDLENQVLAIKQNFYLLLREIILHEITIA